MMHGGHAVRCIKQRRTMRAAALSMISEYGMKRFFRTLCALMLCVSLSGCGAPPSRSADFFAMDTFMSVTVWGQSEAQAQTDLDAVQQRINDLSNTLSRQVSASSLARLNAAGGQAVTLDEDTYAALSRAVEYAELTDGAFDPTTAPLSDLWGIGTEHAAVPDAETLDEALVSVDYRNIELLGNHQARLRNGAQVDLGGIGKGYATDAVSHLADGGAMLAALGGNIGAYGENPNRKDGAWLIGLADPDNSSSYIATVAVENQSVVTSGDYERYFEQNGVRYHHIFDPRTGYPVQNELRAVTVVDGESTRADAMTTALFVMGLDRGMEFCAEQSLDAAFITADHKIYVTDGLKNRLTLAEGSDYEIVG